MAVALDLAPFGPTGVRVSRLGLGTMTFGSPLDEEACGRVLDEALDQGVNLVDTADSYGESEEILGRLLSGGRRGRVFLATKVFKRHEDPKAGRNSRANIGRAIERSLRRLRTDRVDLFQLHHPDPQTPLEETLEALDGLVRAGKTRFVGVTNHYAWQMAQMIGAARLRGFDPIVSFQCCYNLLDRPVEAEGGPFVRNGGMALMAYSPLCCGVLAGRYPRGEPPPPGSRIDAWRGNMLEFIENPAVHDMVDGAREIAAGLGLALNQLAILWLLARPFVTTVLLGGTRPDHFTQIYAAAGRRIPAEVVARLDALTAPRVHKPFRNQPYADAPGRTHS